MGNFAFLFLMVAMLAAPVWATILDFNISGMDQNGVIYNDQNPAYNYYGDQVASAGTRLDWVQRNSANSFAWVKKTSTYAEGDTPNIESYWLSNNMSQWDGGGAFGDLTTATYDNHGTTGDGMLIGFKADAGYSVVIESFDMAHFGSNGTANAFITDGTTKVWQSGSTTISGSTHNTFTPNYTGTDSTKVYWIGFETSGTAINYFGADNIAFSQTGGGLDWGTFTPTANTLTPAERQELYLTMMEAFVTWGENSYWYPDDTLETGGGYYNASGPGVSRPRANDNFCWILAALLTGRPSQSTFTPLNIPRSQLESHLEKTIRTMCLSNKNYSQKQADWWGGPTWTTSLEFNGIAWAAHMQESILAQSTLDMVEEVLGDEADNLIQTIPDMQPGNSYAETCLWNAQLCAFAANKLSSDPRASTWDDMAKKWALNAMSMPGDKDDNTTIVDGQPLSYWVSTTQMNPDYTLINHGFWHPSYNLDFGRHGQAYMSYTEFGNPVPEAFSFRMQGIWDNIGRVLLRADGDTEYPQGNDWAFKDLNHSQCANFYATAWGQSEASAFESRAIQLARQRQVNRGWGSICDYNFGYQCDEADEWASSWMLHNYFSGPTMAYDVAEADSYTVKQYPNGEAGVHRNSDKFVSVSWSDYSQAVQVMPNEGLTTFPDPPFYFTGKRYCGVNGAVSSSLENFETTDNGQGMRVTVKRVRNANIDQYITVVSLPDEATVYSSIFYAKNSTSYTVGELFPLQARWLDEETNKTVTQYTGAKWLNMSDYVGFVSPDNLPGSIPSDKFRLTNSTGYSPTAGDWFSAAAVVVYANQTQQTTSSYASSIGVIRDLANEVFDLTLESSSGTIEVDLWPTHSASGPICGQPGQYYDQTDLNQDCYTNLKDAALVALEWLWCRDPVNLGCLPWDGS